MTEWLKLGQKWKLALGLEKVAQIPVSHPPNDNHSAVQSWVHLHSLWIASEIHSWNNVGSRLVWFDAALGNFLAKELRQFKK